MLDDLAGRVAVVTGAASGIGRALARACAARGAAVVISDVEETPLAALAEELTRAGVRADAVAADVAREEDVAALAERTFARHGSVHLLCNNAGVFAGGTTWEVSAADWSWVVGVNLLGVAHGLRHFLPRMLASGEPGHVVNTASMAALTSAPLCAPYVASKHAVLSLSESLYHELTQQGAAVGVSVLCPESVATRIGESDRNRPATLPRASASPARALVESALRSTTAAGVAPEVLAERTLEAVAAGRFYVLPPDDDGWRRASRTRCEDLLLGRNPSFVVPGAEAAAPERP